VLTEACGSRVTLLQVVQPPTYPLYGDGYTYIPFDEDAELAEARAYLERQAARLGGRGEPVNTVVQVGEPARVIGEIARAQDVDVVVMATHGNGGLSRLILGSVATGTLRHTTAPLLLVRPTAVAHAQPLPERDAVADQSLTTGHRAGESQEPAVTLRVSLEELELVERGLKALGYAPGYDYGHVLAARALADRLRALAQAEVGEAVGAAR
jgi:nucleotide-binding universal stress UspA family protein